MKNLILLLMMLVPIGTFAQVDDMYFIPKKKGKSTVVVSDDSGSSQERFYTGGQTMDVDAYNRRYNESDYETDYESDVTEYDDYSDDDTDYIYSSRIVRFHSPRKVLLSSPWYWCKQLYSS